MEALVVYNAEKLPPEIKELIDTNRPLPPGAQFFEERYTYALLAQRLFWGVVLVPGGLLVLFISGWLSWHIDRYAASYDTTSKIFGAGLIAGLVFTLGGVMLLVSLRRTYRTIRQQDRGIVTRYGVLLVGDLLIYNEDGVTKVVPKAAFKGIKERELQFEQEGRAREFTLPSELVRQDVSSLDAALARWVT